MTEEPGNGRKWVTYPALWGTITGVVVIAGSLNTFVWAQHSGHPHKGAVTDKELDQLEKRFDQRFDSLERYLGRIEEKIK